MTTVNTVHLSTSLTSQYTTNSVFEALPSLQTFSGKNVWIQLSQPLHRHNHNEPWKAWLRDTVGVTFLLDPNSEITLRALLQEGCTPLCVVYTKWQPSQQLLLSSRCQTIVISDYTCPTPPHFQYFIYL